MAWEALADDWHRLGGRLRVRWDKLTDDDLAGIAGKRERLVGKLREVYALSAERVEAELRDWERHQVPIAPTGPRRGF